MDQVRSEIRIASTDAEVNDFLGSLRGEGGPVSRRFSQGEDFFLLLPTEFRVPSLPIHHDVRLAEPSTEYREKIHALLAEVGGRVPGVLGGLTYMFDPAEILRPAFFQLFRCGGDSYLFLLRVDLQWRPVEHETVRRGDNDRTAEYLSRKLYLEADIIPLEGVITDGGRTSGFRIRRSISQTWIGERGRGYFVQGIWIDLEITKFFSRLLLPPGKRMYPYYPYTCKHRAVCRSVVEPETGRRERFVPLLHRARLFLEPRMKEIEEALKNADFSENLEAFADMKNRIPAEWYDEWKTTEIRAYLNDKDMKEYLLENPT